jgi:hypothetical protein
MPENKTKPTAASVDDYLAAIEDITRRSDCAALVEMMSNITKQAPIMWGDSIVGFGSYHYKYESGREGDAALTGFSSRKGDISVYLVASGTEQEQQLAKLGRHKMGKSCLYIRRLCDIDTKILGQLIADSVAEVRRRYG